MDASGIVDFARRRPWIAGAAALVAAIPVAAVWAGGRGSAPTSAASYNGVIGDSVTGRIVAPAPTETTPAAPLPPPGVGTIGGFTPAPLPKGFKCPSGGRPVYQPKPGSFVQTTAEVVCVFADRRQVPLVKA